MILRCKNDGKQSFQHKSVPKPELGNEKKKKKFIIMKSKLQKQSDILLTCLYIILPIMGIYIGYVFSGYLASVIFAILGLIAAFIVDILMPRWKYDLTWGEIDIALNNMYKYGHIPSEICFRVGKRRIFVYRDERDNTRTGQKPSTRIRMAICIPLIDWSDLLTENDFDNIFKLYGGKSMYSSNRGPKSYDVFARIGQEVEDSKGMLKYLFEKAVGGLRPEIMAESGNFFWRELTEKDITKIASLNKRFSRTIGRLLRKKMT